MLNVSSWNNLICVSKVFLSEYVWSITTAELTRDSSFSSSSSSSSHQVRFCDDVEEFFASCGEEEEDRRGPWEELARDRCRFLRRCQEVEQSIAYCLQPQHRCLVASRLTVLYVQDNWGRPVFSWGHVSSWGHEDWLHRDGTWADCWLTHYSPRLSLQLQWTRPTRFRVSSGRTLDLKGSACSFAVTGSRHCGFAVTGSRHCVRLKVFQTSSRLSFRCAGFDVMLVSQTSCCVKMNLLRVDVPSLIVLEENWY